MAKVNIKKYLRDANSRGVRGALPPDGSEFSGFFTLVPHNGVARIYFRGGRLRVANSRGVRGALPPYGSDFSGFLTLVPRKNYYFFKILAKKSVLENQILAINNGD